MDDFDLILKSLIAQDSPESQNEAKPIASSSSKKNKLMIKKRGSRNENEKRKYKEKFKRLKPKNKKILVKDFIWSYYELDKNKEIDYLKNLYLKCSNSAKFKLDEKALGLLEPKLSGEVGQNISVNKINNKNSNLAATLGNSSKIYINVVESINSRIRKVGRVDIGMSSSYREKLMMIYDENDLIDDPEEEKILLDSTFKESSYDDYFRIDGDLRDFFSSRFYQKRQLLINKKLAEEDISMKEEHRVVDKKRLRIMKG